MRAPRVGTDFLFRDGTPSQVWQAVLSQQLHQEAHFVASMKPRSAAESS